MDQNTGFMVCKMPKMSKNRKNPQNFKHFACFLEFHGMQHMKGRHRTTPQMKMHRQTDGAF